MYTFFCSHHIVCTKMQNRFLLLCVFSHYMFVLLAWALRTCYKICRVIIIYFECVWVYTKLLMWGHRYRIYIITQLLAAGISQVYVYTSKYKFEWNEMTTNTVYKKIEKKEAPSDQKIFWPILGYEEIIKMYKNFTISYWSLVQSRESLYNK